MKAVALAFLIGLVACASTSRAGSAPPPTPVASVDLERYVGLWYEVAKIPNRFQKQCVRGTTARYTIREDGRIDVINSCVTEDGTLDEAKGLAKVVDPTSNAKLEVNFFRLLGLRLFWGDYWIIGLGDDYEYAIVGTPDRKYGWILSRTPEITPKLRARIDDELRAQGYDPVDFEPTAQ